MNCIGHEFIGNKENLIRVRAFLDKVDSPKVLASTDDIKLYKVKVSFSTNRLIERRALMSMRNKEWVEDISSNSVTLRLDNIAQIENRIIQFKQAIERYSVRIFQEQVKAVYYEGIGFEEKVYEITLRKSDKGFPRSNEDYKNLILDYELSA